MTSRAPTHRILGLLVGLVAACKPGLPVDPDVRPDEPPPPDDTDVDSDAGPIDRCAVREVEPNATAAEATALPLEARACGAVDVAGDADAWSFALDQPAWLEVRVDAARLGSRADVLVDVEGGGLRATATDVPDGTDARLVVPAEPGSFVAVVQPQGPQAGGADFFYEVRASVTKPPLDATTAEAADNDTVAQVLASEATGAGGVVLVGGWSDPGDVDTYAIEVPAGAHRVEIAGLAHPYGSPSDMLLRFVDAAGETTSTVASGAFGDERDPAWEATRTGPVTLRVQVVEERLRAGPAYWYGLRVAVTPVSAGEAP